VRKSGFIGVLMLDTDFPRPVGDIGNRNSFPTVPMRFEKVPKAYAQRVLNSDPESELPELFPAFLKAAQNLQDQGALGITTSCGFLAPLQKSMAEALTLPVALSSLLQVAWVQSLLPLGKVCGVITIDADRLKASHLSSVGASADTPVVGMPSHGAFAELVFEAEERASPLSKLAPKRELRRRQAIEAELIQAAIRMPAHTGAIVLECTNLPPYRAALKRATNLPIYDIQTLIHWFWSGLQTR
jgi:Asp/Glu/hydantoin racemase